MGDGAADEAGCAGDEDVHVGEKSVGWIREMIFDLVDSGCWGQWDRTWCFARHLRGDVCILMYPLRTFFIPLTGGIEAERMATDRPRGFK